MRGRKPKPTALKKLQGNPGRRKPVTEEPKPQPVSGMAPPAHLSAEGKREWNRKFAELRQLGMVSALDLGLLAAWCSAWADYVQSELKIRHMGAIIEGRDKNLVRNPWTLIRAKAVEQMVRIGSEFGLSPASRPRLGRGAALPAEGLHGKSTNAQQPEAGSLQAFLAGDPDRKTAH